MNKSQFEFIPRCKRRGIRKAVSTMAVKRSWARRPILFFDDLLCGRKPKRKSRPPDYEEYMIAEHDCWNMVNQTDGRQALLTTKGFD